jgi:hypothetical protein
LQVFQVVDEEVVGEAAEEETFQQGPLIKYLVYLTNYE